MFKRLLLMLVMVGLITGAPRDSRADGGSAAAIGVAIAAGAALCGPFYEVCKQNLIGKFLIAIQTRAKIYVETFMEEINLEFNKKITVAQSINAQKLATAVEQLHAANDIQHGVGGASCAVASIGQSMLLGGRSNTPSVDSNAYTGSADSIHGPAPMTFTFPSPYGPNGRRRAIGKELYNTESRRLPFDQYRDTITEKMGKVDADRRDGMLPGSENRWADAKTQFDEHTNNYGPTQPLEMFQNADIRAETILAHDTFPDTENTPVDKTKNSDGGTRTLWDAAKQYCQNISDPTILDPSKGSIVGKSADRQLYNNERNGWMARLSLASTICQEAISRRTAKMVDQSSPVDSSGTAPNTSTSADPGIKNEWFRNTMDAYKKLNCVKSVAYTDSNGNTAYKTVPDQACRDQVDTDMKPYMHVSEYETMKTVYTRLLFTPKAIQLLGTAQPNETLKMMTQLDQLDLLLSYRVYELQQKLAMIKAAQLATMVSAQKRNPELSGPGQ